MRINTNVSALNAWRNLQITDRNLSKSLERLSSGYRINKAADDAAGLAVSERMRGQIRGLNQAIRNAQDGISMIQTAEGGLQETHAILQRMRELAVQAANGTLQNTDRQQLDKEFQQLKQEVDRIANTTTFNGQKLLNGLAVTFQVGPNAGEIISASVGSMDASTLGVASLQVSTLTDASTAIGQLDAAISAVSGERANLGSVQNRLEHTINNLSVSVENLTAAESRIRDADIAQEMAEYTKNQILLQAGTAMLAQANVKSQSVLALLQ